MSTGRIILMRHGETTSNVAQLLDTRPPGAWLTDRGQEQAREAGRVCAQDYPKLAAVYCSIAIRAGQTAMLLSAEYERLRGQRRGSLPVRSLAGVQEVDMGDWEMRGDDAAFQDYYHCLAGWLGGDPDARAPGGENYCDVLHRYRPALEQVRRRHGKDDVVIVSHGAATRVAAVHACGVDPDFAFENRLANCRRIILEPGENDFGQWRLVEWGV
ncbi:histidine phosphatase family protein [Corynebacterium poyangense]|uniref:Histidine phosphatase family protein n=1 Tax=Corynebacterium poyangense TaxID=2684405 RepID=A0A7H0SRS2_9CORY|nr:histidine phosphatase family protein [Corynebacterium poyangense]MBZ8176681.1 histidine phosphatase family protein [Corynebacterium poyangense]QNQ91247.1 histidine phosphatase family protein [Corynebacterium poyangense]